MKHAIAIGVLFSLLSLSFAAATDPGRRARSTIATPLAIALAESDAEREKREADFAALLSGATLNGQWRFVRDGKLGRELEEKYTLGKVERKDGKWSVEARIQYGDKDVRVPIPVDVTWAGDTPILAVTDLWIPGLGKYTARVMFYRGLYNGSWFGTDYGGLMSGVIEPAKPEPAPPGADGDDAGRG